MLAERRILSSGARWEPLVGYSRAVRAGDWISVAGTTAELVNGQPAGGTDLAEQTRSAIRRIAAALEQLGGQLSDVVRTRIFLTDITRWEEAGRVHGEFFADVRPVASMIEIRALIDPRLLVEIEADAIVTGRGPQLAVVDGLDVVTVQVAQEHPVVARVVLRELTRGVQHLRPGCHRRLVHRVHRGAVGGLEGDVEFPGLGAGGRPEPEHRLAVGAAQADHDGLAVREAHHLVHPDRAEGAEVEVERLLHVLDLQADVIKHGRSLTGGYDIAAQTGIGIRVGPVYRGVRSRYWR
jgi:enamine deaminase RidA (YjgF/YER057c/UK114 family)